MSIAPNSLAARSASPWAAAEHASPSTLAVVVLTLAIAALHNPLHCIVQALVDRRFYRSKYDAAKTLAAFNSRLREETDLDSLSDEVLGVVRETMQPEYVSLWLRPHGLNAKEDVPR